MKQITRFWKYFQKNEQDIFNALLLGINTEEVFAQINKKFDYISKRISFIIKVPKTNQEKYTLIFTCGGYRKLFTKIIALENLAPPLELFIAQAFIRPLEGMSMYKDGTDEPFICDNYEIKASEIQMALLDYNIDTKHLKINLYLPQYEECRHFEDLNSNIDWIIMVIVGEIAFRKHIKEIHLHPMPLEPKGLFPLPALPDFIEYLYQINSRKKTRKI